MVIMHVVAAKVWGGGEQYVYDVSREQKASGHKVVVVVDSSVKEIAERFSDAAEVETASIRSPLGLMALNKLASLVKKHGVEAVFYHSGSIAVTVALLKSITGVKLVFVKHNLSQFKNDFFHRWLFGKIDAVVCVSESVLTQQKETAPVCFANKFHVIYNGIDDKQFSYSQRHRENNRRFTFGYAGRLVENKGILVLLEAAAELRRREIPFELRICGKGNPAFEKEIRGKMVELELQEQVKMLGYTRDMPAFYNSIDAFILPSITKESFGLALCEAMYSGCAVIATNSGAQEEIVTNNETGLIVEPSSVQELVMAMVRLLDNEELTEMLSEKGHNKVAECFTISNCCAKIDELLKTI